MTLVFTRQLEEPRLVLGYVEVSGGAVGPASAALRQRCEDCSAQWQAAGFELDEGRRSAVRRVLKTGGFSPTGRNRPAHELLLNDLAERMQNEDPAARGFHYINNIVDVNNVISLECCLPISIFDADKLDGALSVRIAEEGEGYVFNASGHYLDLKRCIICARGPAPGTACGSPIKDSMECKVFERADHFAGVIYGSLELYSAAELAAWTQRFGELLANECGGELRVAELR